MKVLLTQKYVRGLEEFSEHGSDFAGKSSQYVEALKTGESLSNGANLEKLLDGESLFSVRLDRAKRAILAFTKIDGEYVCLFLEVTDHYKGSAFLRSNNAFDRWLERNVEGIRAAIAEDTSSLDALDITGADLSAGAGAGGAAEPELSPREDLINFSLHDGSLIQLKENQEKAIESVSEHILKPNHAGIVVGPPGAGKSLSIVEICSEFLSKPGFLPAGGVAVLTQQPALRKAIAEQLVFRGVDAKKDLGLFDYVQYAKTYLQWPDDKTAITQDEAIAWVQKQIQSDDAFKDVEAAQVYRELCLISLKNNLDEYKAIGRLSGFNGNDDVQKRIWELKGPYNNHCQRDDLFDPNMTVMKSKKDIGQPILLVDECTDLTAAQVASLKGAHSLALFGDDHQEIGVVSTPIDVIRNVYRAFGHPLLEMSINNISHRVPERIVQVLNHLLNVSHKLKRGKTRALGYRKLEAAHGGGECRVILPPKGDSLTEELKAYTDDPNTFFIALTDSGLDEIKEWFEDPALAFTPAQVKGLEAQRVVLYLDISPKNAAALNNVLKADGKISKEELPKNHADLIKQLAEVYTACSRSQQELVVIAKRKLQSFAKGLLKEEKPEPAAGAGEAKVDELPSAKPVLPVAKVTWEKRQQELFARGLGTHVDKVRNKLDKAYQITFKLPMRDDKSGAKGRSRKKAAHKTKQMSVNLKWPLVPESYGKLLGLSLNPVKWRKVFTEEKLALYLTQIIDTKDPGFVPGLSEMFLQIPKIKEKAAKQLSSLTSDIKERAELMLALFCNQFRHVYSPGELLLILRTHMCFEPENLAMILFRKCAVLWLQDISDDPESLESDPRFKEIMHAVVDMYIHDSETSEAVHNDFVLRLAQPIESKNSLFRILISNECEDALLKIVEYARKKPKIFNALNHHLYIPLGENRPLFEVASANCPDGIREWIKLCNEKKSELSGADSEMHSEQAVLKMIQKKFQKQCSEILCDSELTPEGRAKALSEFWPKEFHFIEPFNAFLQAEPLPETISKLEMFKRFLVCCESNSDFTEAFMRSSCFLYRIGEDNLWVSIINAHGLGCIAELYESSFVFKVAFAVAVRDLTAAKIAASPCNILHAAVGIGSKPADAHGMLSFLKSHMHYSLVIQMIDSGSPESPMGKAIRLGDGCMSTSYYNFKSLMGVSADSATPFSDLLSAFQGGVARALNHNGSGAGK